MGPICVECGSSVVKQKLEADDALLLQNTMMLEQQQEQQNNKNNKESSSKSTSDQKETSSSTNKNNNTKQPVVKTPTLKPSASFNNNNIDAAIADDDQSNNNAYNTQEGILSLLYDKNEKILRQCTRCGNVCDPFIETDDVVLGLNVALLRKPAWRHSIHNQRNGVLYFAFVASIVMEVMLAMCWRQSILLKQQHEQHQQHNFNNFNNNANNTSTVSSSMFSYVVTSALTFVDEMMMSSSTNTNNNANYFSSMILPFVAMLTAPPGTVPATLQLSNYTSNPLYSYEYVTNQQQQQQQQQQSYNDAAAAVTFTNLIPFLYGYFSTDTLRIIFALGLCALGEVVLFAFSVVSFLNIGGGGGGTTITTSLPSALVVTRGVLLASCAKLGLLPFFVWAIPLDLLSLLEIVQVFWYYLAAGALLIEEKEQNRPTTTITTTSRGRTNLKKNSNNINNMAPTIRRLSVVAVTLILRSAFRIVTQWTPILGWF